MSSAATASILALASSFALLGIGFGYRHQLTRWPAALLRACGLLVGLGAVVWQVTQHGALLGVDHTTTSWVVSHRTPVLDTTALFVTNTFGPVATSCAAVGLALVAIVRFGSYVSALMVVGTIGGASLLSTAMKLLVKRGRPPIGLQETLETDYSMPSGHVTGAVALLGMLVVVVGLGRSKAMNGWLVSTAVVVVAAVASSRLYLGVHWFTDVLAAVLLGSAAMTIGATALRAHIEHNGSESPGHPVGTRRHISR